MQEQKEKKIKNFTDLFAWQEGHRLVLMIYKITKKFPKEEQFSLINQIQRAIVSVTSCIAEGFSRESLKDKIHFYRISQGSLTEVQNQLLIAKDLGYIRETEYIELLNQSIKTHKLITGLIKYLKREA